MFEWKKRREKREKKVKIVSKSRKFECVCALCPWECGSKYNFDRKPWRSIRPKKLSHNSIVVLHTNKHRKKNDSRMPDAQHNRWKWNWNSFRFLLSPFIAIKFTIWYIFSLYIRSTLATIIFSFFWFHSLFAPVRLTRLAVVFLYTFDSSQFSNYFSLDFISRVWLILIGARKFQFSGVWIRHYADVWRQIWYTLYLYTYMRIKYDATVHDAVVVAASAVLCCCCCWFLLCLFCHLSSVDERVKRSDL